MRTLPARPARQRTGGVALGRCGLQDRQAAHQTGQGRHDERAPGAQCAVSPDAPAAQGPLRMPSPADAPPVVFEDREIAGEWRVEYLDDSDKPAQRGDRYSCARSLVLSLRLRPLCAIRSRAPPRVLIIAHVRFAPTDDAFVRPRAGSAILLTSNCINLAVELASRSHRVDAT
jgi:hypothetical protein